MSPTDPPPEPSKPPRHKVLSRTGVVLFLVGLVGFVAMVGATIYIAASETRSAGPGHVASWPAGEELAVLRPIGARDERPASPGCTVTPDGGQPRANALEWHTPTEPFFTGNGTITCETPAVVVTGPEMGIVAATKGPLIIVPLALVFVGIMLVLIAYFPRFMHAWGMMSSPIAADRKAKRRE